MGNHYKFTEAEIKLIRETRKQNTNKRAEKRLYALQLWAEGANAAAVAEKTGFCSTHITRLTMKYRKGGIEAIAGNHYGGHHRNMSEEEEKQILEPFQKQAEKGQLVTILEIKQTYEKAVGHPIGGEQIYRVLKRHGWRKIMPRSHHPKKANEEDIASSKKLTQRSKN